MYNTASYTVLFMLLIIRFLLIIKLVQQLLLGEQSFLHSLTPFQNQDNYQPY